jgi:hypothetical protein
MAPYDVAAWTLPMMMGVTVESARLSEAERGALRLLKAEDWPKGGLNGSGAVAVLDRSATAGAGFLNEALKAGGAQVALQAFEAEGRRFEAGSILLKSGSALEQLAARHHVALRTLAGKPEVKQAAMKAPRVGLLKPWAASMDEGWTRWILEQYGFAPKSLEPKAVQAGKLRDSLDVLVLPDVSKAQLLNGRSGTDGEGGRRFVEEVPAEYSGGLGKEGMKALKEFVEQGGTLVALASASELLMDEWGLPVRNTLAGARGGEDFSCPGSILHMHFETSHPVGYGMSQDGFGFLDGRLAFQTSPSSPQNRRAVIASYPDDARDILASGWIKGAERLERKSAAVALELGKGKVVLFGFRVQHRAQTEETFKLLFNAIYWSAMGE